MAIINSDTQVSPGIGDLDDKFSILGGIIIDLVGTSGKRVTAQMAPSSLFKGWTGTSEWLIVGATHFNASSILGALGGGIAKANFRITLYDGDCGSPNPVYVAMFLNEGASTFPYVRNSPQPRDYDFDGGGGGGILRFGFVGADGIKRLIGLMSSVQTVRLGPSPSYTTIDTFTGFVGTFALTDTRSGNNLGYTAPSQYMTPVQSGVANGIWPCTGWMQVPDSLLPDLFAVISTGAIQVGTDDLTPGDQYWDFTQGLGVDLINIPFEVPPTPTPTPTVCGTGNVAF